MAEVQIGPGLSARDHRPMAELQDSRLPARDDRRLAEMHRTSVSGKHSRQMAGLQVTCLPGRHDRRLASLQASAVRGWFHGALAEVQADNGGRAVAADMRCWMDRNTVWRGVRLQKEGLYCPFAERWSSHAVVCDAVAGNTS